MYNLKQGITMKIKNSMKFIALSVVASTLFVGCGSSSDDAVAGITLNSGTFVDAPVQGLYYESDAKSGYLNDKGEFEYLLADSNITFKLGNLVLGQGPAGVFMTPYSISDNNNTATNIALLLQNFDNDRTNTGILDLSLLKDANLSDVNLSATTSDMETTLGNLFDDDRFATNYSGSVLLDAAAVKGTMDSYIEDNAMKYDKKFTQAYLDTVDFYVADKEYGSQIQRFDGGELYYAGDSYTDHDTGLVVQGDGYNGVFNIDGSGVASYTLNNGNIVIAYGGGSFIITTKILEVTDTYVKVFQSAPTGETRTVKWYTDKDEAIKNTITVQYGFGENTLNDTTYYVPDPTGKTSNVFTMLFKNEKWSVPQDSSINQDFTIVNGYTVVDERSMGNTFQYTKVTAVDEYKITACSVSGAENITPVFLDANGNCDTNIRPNGDDGADVVTMYYNLSDAQARK